MQGRAKSLGKEKMTYGDKNKKVLQEAPFRVEYSMRLGV